MPRTATRYESMQNNKKTDLESAVSWLFFGGSLSISMRNLLREQGTGFGEPMT
jgi:hypothetical protein